MGKLSKANEFLRTDLALQVYAILQANKGMTQADACEKVGISTYQYRKWIATAAETLELFREARAGVRRLELERVLLAREAIFEKLIQDGLSSLISAEERLAIHQYLVAHGDRLMDEVHVSSGNEADFLTGPQLHHADSIFSPSEVTITIKQKPGTVIDITPSEGDDTD